MVDAPLTQAQAAGKLPPTKEGAHPVGPWVPDTLDIGYPPCDPRNRGNLDYKPVFAEPEKGDREPAARKATGLMLSGDFKLPAGTFDNISGSPAFQYSGLQNPLWRWDATGRQTQWVRP